jgi:phosphohistidine phosphatase
MVDGLRLYFLRHGRADRSQYHGDDDDLRPLTDEGRRRLRVSADFIAGLEPGIDLIVTSPLARAAQTAEIVAARLGLIDDLKVDDRLGFGFGLSSLAAMLAGLEGDHRHLMLVGHEPSFSEVIGELIGDGFVCMKKGALARVDLLPGREPRGRLIWLLQPRVMLSGDSDPDDGEPEED